MKVVKFVATQLAILTIATIATLGIYFSDSIAKAVTHYQENMTVLILAVCVLAVVLWVMYMLKKTSKQLNQVCERAHFNSRFYSVPISEEDQRAIKRAYAEEQQ